MPVVDGAPLAQSQVLAGNDIPERAEFQDVRQFLLNGGQKGPQRKILREGTYAINTTQFAITRTSASTATRSAPRSNTCMMACGKRSWSVTASDRW